MYLLKILASPALPFHARISAPFCCPGDVLCDAAKPLPRNLSNLPEHALKFQEQQKEQEI